MLRKLLVYTVLIPSMLLLGGCATARKQNNLEIQGLKNQISAMEAQLRSKDEEINNLRGSLTQAEQEKSKLEVNKGNYTKGSMVDSKWRPTVREIQEALKNAGYDPGLIDGKMGKQTRDAIRAFQKANHLKVTGKVGRKTWSLLKEYLDKKAK